MTKTRKFIKTVICVLLAVCCLSATLGIVACSDGKDDGKPKKYDVNIRVANNFGQTWVFPVGVDELTYEFEYTGEEMRFHVDAYQLVAHPRYGDQWFSPNQEGANVFETSLNYVHQMYYEEDPKFVKERDNYYYRADASSTSNIWNYRSVRLNINVI